MKSYHHPQLLRDVHLLGSASSSLRFTDGQGMLARGSRNRLACPSVLGPGRQFPVEDLSPVDTDFDQRGIQSQALVAHKQVDLVLILWFGLHLVPFGTGSPASASDRTQGYPRGYEKGDQGFETTHGAVVCGQARRWSRTTGRASGMRGWMELRPLSQAPSDQSVRAGRSPSYLGSSAVVRSNVALRGTASRRRSGPVVCRATDAKLSAGPEPSIVLPIALSEPARFSALTLACYPRAP